MSIVATRPSRMGSASGRKSARTRMSRSPCANDRWWRSRAANGDGPGFSPIRHAPLCAGPDRGKLRNTSGLRGAGPRGHAPGRCPGSAPGARYAQRLRHLLTYALPYFAVQTRIELTRVHVALADLAGARTLMREVDELLRRRPASEPWPGRLRLWARLAKERGSGAAGASALTAAELRLLPMLSTHLSFPEIAGGIVPVRQHHQVPGDFDLPEAGRRLTQPGGHPVPRARAPGRVTTRYHPAGGCSSSRPEVQ